MNETPSNRHDDIGTSPRCPTEVIENKPICLSFRCCIRDLRCLNLALLPPRITSCLRPSLAHVPMEPLNVTMRFDGDHVEVWSPTQSQTWDLAALAKVLVLKAEQITCHTEFAGGGFGRWTVFDSDVLREAAAIAKRLRGTPVKLVWTREDDVRGGYYRPMFVHHVEVGIGQDGIPAAWKHVVVGQSYVIGTG